jgi:hypothetical protein
MWDNFTVGWPIDEWPEEDRALALRFAEVGSGRCWIVSKIGGGQPFDELAAAIDEIELSDDLAEAGEETPGGGGTIGDRTLGGFYVEWHIEHPGFSRDDGYKIFVWHVHAAGVHIHTLWEEWQPPIETDIPEAEASPEQLQEVVAELTTAWEEREPVREVIEYTMTLDQLEEYMGQLPRQFPHWSGPGRAE